MKEPQIAEPKEAKMATTEMTITIQPNDKGNPPAKLAHAELHFTTGPLEGLKLIGFSVWERRGGTGRNVTFPARQYSVNGERRSFALLRPITDTRRKRLSAMRFSRHTPRSRPRLMSGNSRERRSAGRRSAAQDRTAPQPARVHLFR
jgi:hypothetical protein